MLTVICALKFRDGKTLVAVSTADTPYDDAPVFYSGEVARYPDRQLKGPVMGMRYLMQCHAEKLGAEFVEKFEGRFVADE